MILYRSSCRRSDCSPVWNGLRDIDHSYEDATAQSELSTTQACAKWSLQQDQKALEIYICCVCPLNRNLVFVCTRNSCDKPSCHRVTGQSCGIDIGDCPTRHGYYKRLVYVCPLKSVLRYVKCVCHAPHMRVSPSEEDKEAPIDRNAVKADRGSESENRWCTNSVVISIRA